MRTATAAVAAAPAPLPAPSQKPSVATDSASTTGTKTALMRSASRCTCGLAVLGLLHQPCHLRELGLLADPGRLHHDPAAGVDRRTHDRVARAHLDRHALAGDRARVDRRRALHDGPVGRDLLAGPDDEAVADDEVLDGDAHLGAPADDGDVLGPQLEQGTQRGTGAALGPGLGVPAGEQERRHARRRLEVDVARAVAAPDRQRERVRHPDLPGRAEQQGVQRPGERGQRAERDQRVHRRGPVTQVRPGGAVERQRAPDHDRRREGEREPLPAVDLQRRDHRESDDGDGQRDADQQPLAQGPGSVRLLGAPAAGRGLRRPRQRCRVPGGGDGREQLLGGHLRRVADPGLLGGVVDGGRHALELVELALDAGGAGRARHARDRQLERGALRRVRAHCWPPGTVVDSTVKAAVCTAPSCRKSRNSRYVPGVGTSTAKGTCGPAGPSLRVHVQVGEVAGAQGHQVPVRAEVRLQVADRRTSPADGERRGRRGPGRQVAAPRDGVAVDGGRAARGRQRSGLEQTRHRQVRGEHQALVAAGRHEVRVHLVRPGPVEAQRQAPVAVRAELRVHVLERHQVTAHHDQVQVALVRGRVRPERGAVRAGHREGERAGADRQDGLVELQRVPVGEGREPRRSGRPAARRVRVRRVRVRRVRVRRVRVRRVPVPGVPVRRGSVRRHRSGLAGRVPGVRPGHAAGRADRADRRPDRGRGGEDHGQAGDEGDERGSGAHGSSWDGGTGGTGTADRTGQRAGRVRR